LAKVLLVIGNGFDLAHGMKTSYYDFRNWLNGFAHKEYVAKMENNLNCYGDMLWTNFEENTKLLSRIDYKEKFYKYSSYLTECSAKIIDQNGNLVVRDAEDNNGIWAVADFMGEIFNQQGFQHYLEEELFWLYRLKELFFKWIKSIELPPNPMYSIPQNVLCLNFNYTNLLEDTYKIVPEKILHIHGSTDNEIEFGNPDLASLWLQNEDARALQVKDEINNALKSVHKDVMSIISKNQSFFNNLNKIQKIYILGHSMNEIDEQYFLKIKENVSPNARWIASYHNEKDKLRAEFIFGKLGINRFEIKKLDDIFKYA